MAICIYLSGNSFELCRGKHVSGYQFLAFFYLGDLFKVWRFPLWSYLTGSNNSNPYPSLSLFLSLSLSLKMLEISACMELKAKSGELTEGTDSTDTEFSDISFEELLAQEKKDSFWSVTNLKWQVHNPFWYYSSIIIICLSMCRQKNGKPRPCSSWWKRLLVNYTQVSPIVVRTFNNRVMNHPSIPFHAIFSCNMLLWINLFEQNLTNMFHFPFRFSQWMLINQIL